MRQSTLVLTELTPNEAASVVGGRGGTHRAVHGRTHIHADNFTVVGSGYASGGDVENGNVVVIVGSTNYTINSVGGDTNNGGTGTVTLTF